MTFATLVSCCTKLPLLIPGRLIAVKKVNNETAMTVLKSANPGNIKIEYSLRTMQKYAGAIALVKKSNQPFKNPQ